VCGATVEQQLRATGNDSLLRAYHHGEQIYNRYVTLLAPTFRSFTSLSDVLITIVIDFMSILPYIPTPLASVPIASPIEDESPSTGSSPPISKFRYNLVDLATHFPELKHTVNITDEELAKARAASAGSIALHVPAAYDGGDLSHEEVNEADTTDGIASTICE
jgi:hypothetical protein